MNFSVLHLSCLQSQCHMVLADTSKFWCHFGWNLAPSYHSCYQILCADPGKRLLWEVVSQETLQVKIISFKWTSLHKMGLLGHRILPQDTFPIVLVHHGRFQ